MMATVEQLLARLGSGIESTAEVCGGDPRISTRIPVWTLEYRRLGLTEAQILGAFCLGRPTWSTPGRCRRSPRNDRQIRENEEASS